MSFLFFAELIEGQDMFVFYMGVHFGLAQEALAREAIMHEVGANNFDGYFTIKDAALSCEVDFSHSTNINTTDQVIVAKSVFILFLADRISLFIGSALLLFHR